LIALRSNPGELLARHIDGTARNYSRQLIELAGDRAGIGEQAIHRDQCSQCGKDRKQTVVGHACGQRQYTVIG
jgi:hypothetical protein